MRLVDLLQSLAFLVYIVAILLVATRLKMVRRLERAQAFDAASALEVAVDRPWRKFIRARLEADGVLRRAADGRFWLDRTAHAHRRDMRRRRALMVFGGAALVGAIVAAIGWLLRGRV